MELFGGSDSSRAAQLAQLHLKTWEAGLALRISLQKPLDVCNKLPVYDECTTENLEGGVASEEIRGRLGDMIDLLEAQQPTANKSKKRKFDVFSADEDKIWEHISHMQSDLKVGWKPTVDKWHARLNYGSEKSKSSLKILSSTVWEQVGPMPIWGCHLPYNCIVYLLLQINRALSDDSLVLEKSRPLLLSSKRLDKPSNEYDPASTRDLEVYDDMQFYSMLLKVMCDYRIEYYAIFLL